MYDFFIHFNIMDRINIQYSNLELGTSNMVKNFLAEIGGIYAEKNSLRILIKRWKTN